MMLKLPLHCYDDSGRVKPPMLLWLLIVYLCKPVFMLMAGFGMPRDNLSVYLLFYPTPAMQKISVALAVVAVICMLVLGLRETLWQHRHRWVLFAVKPLLLLAVLAEASMFVGAAQTQYWAFSWQVAISLLISLGWGAWLLKSRHLRIMLTDWRQP